ncbi:MAG: PRC-barrel domain-containing protein [Peptococcaceae bacterium]|nr:PRC-barrel domain-containing protein [Peptococcaceae bacterium]
MRKSKQFLGLPVISLEEGQQVGTVKGLVVNPTLKNVAALIIEQKGLFREQKFIPYSKVHSTGEDAVTIDHANWVGKGVSLPEILKLYKERVNITGSRLVTENGTVLGIVDEYYVDLQTGDIVGLEFSGGTVSSLLKGSAFLDINHVRTLGPKVVICNDSSLNNIVRMDGGLQETFRAIRENTGQILETTAQKTRGWGKNLNQSIEKFRRSKADKKANGDAGDTGQNPEQRGPCGCGQHGEDKL